MTNEVYFSVDIEADGPIPGEYSMLNLGAAAYKSNGLLLGTYDVNLEVLPDATTDPSTMEWWATQPEAWTAVTESPVSPKRGMFDFVNWVESTSKMVGRRPVFVGYPAGFDFLFVYWYLIKFVGRSPFSFSALDIKTLAFAYLKRGYRKSTKKYMPKRWFDKKLKHTHVGVNDAIEQGALFCEILKDLEIE